MTLGIVLGNSDQIIQATDRRLTGLKGELIDDSANKAGHALCEDASFLYCFTGLARVGNAATTSCWLLGALYDAAQKSHRYFDIVPAFSQIATDFFDSFSLRRLPASARRLTIMFTGYTADGFIVNSLISNFQDFENGINHFKAKPAFSYVTVRSIKPASENPTVIQAIGQFGALTMGDKSQLREMLERRAPAEAIRQKAISLIQRVSNRPRSLGTVGKKINTARMRSSDPLWPVSGSASDEPERTLHLIDQINLLPGAPKVLLYDAQLSTEFPVFFPRVHRNAPCPCGSGTRFRLCHGKPRPSSK